DGREVARRAADAAAEVEHMHAGAHARPLRMLTRRQNAAPVQLVVRPQLLEGRPLRVDASRREGSLDPFQLILLSSVVALHSAFQIAHRAASFSASSTAASAAS